MDVELVCWHVGLACEIGLVGGEGVEMGFKTWMGMGFVTWNTGSQTRYEYLEVIQNGNKLKKGSGEIVLEGSIILPPTTADDTIAVQRGIYGMQSKLNYGNQRDCTNVRQLQKILSQLTNSRPKPDEEDINLSFFSEISIRKTTHSSRYISRAILPYVSTDAVTAAKRMTKAERPNLLRSTTT
ncbi:hypothetical protein Tco_0333169 [Tanacetum coccineum]